MENAYLLITIGTIVFAAGGFYAQYANLSNRLERLDQKVTRMFEKIDAIEDLEAEHFANIRVVLMAFAQRSGNPKPNVELIKMVEMLGIKK